MPWAKGQSGNPGGKKKTTMLQRYTITEIARQHAPTAILTLVKVMTSPKSTMTARAIAADRLLDRAYGKAPQAIALGVVDASRPASSFSDAELASIIAGAARTLAVPAIAAVGDVGDGAARRPREMLSAAGPLDGIDILEAEALDAEQSPEQCAEQSPSNDPADAGSRE